MDPSVTTMTLSTSGLHEGLWTRARGPTASLTFGLPCQSLPVASETNTTDIPGQVKLVKTHSISGMSFTSRRF